MLVEERLIDSLKSHPINERIYGDLFDHELIKSIEDYGFKGTIEISKDDVIISGHRRYNACQELGYETIPVTVLDITDEDDLINYLIRMNQSQRKRSNEQIACEYEVIKEIEARKAAKRQVRKPLISVVENSTPQIKPESNGKAREKAAEKLNAGWSSFTAENALKVKKYIDEIKEDHPARADHLTDLLNNQSVNAAFNEVKKVRAEIKKEIQDKIREEAEKKHQAEMAELLKVAEDVELEPNIEPEVEVNINPEIKPEVPIEEKENPVEFFNPDFTPEPEPEPVKKSKFNATNDNIEWAKWSWNPVTGCLHNCPYCYAKDIATRYNGGDFSPQFHEDRLNAPEFTTIPKNRIDEPGINNVFVCSMADLFGKWVDASWIQSVIDVCREQPQWTYLMLTKNPERYLEFEFPENCWIGASATNQDQFDRAIETFEQLETECVKFLSCEPLNEEIYVYTESFDETLNGLHSIDWLIIGGRSQSMNMPAFQPEWSWVQHLIVAANDCEVPIYFKPNLTVRPKQYPEK